MDRCVRHRPQQFDSTYPEPPAAVAEGVYSNNTLATWREKAAGCLSERTGTAAWNLTVSYRREMTGQLSRYCSPRQKKTTLQPPKTISRIHFHRPTISGSVLRQVFRQILCGGRHDRSRKKNGQRVVLDVLVLESPSLRGVIAAPLRIRSICSVYRPPPTHIIQSTPGGGKPLWWCVHQARVR